MGRVRAGTPGYRSLDAHGILPAGPGIGSVFGSRPGQFFFFPTGSPGAVEDILVPGQPGNGP